MTAKPRRSIFVTLACLSLASARAAFAADDPVARHAADMEQGLALFQSDVAKLLTEHCVKCHGGEKGTKGELNLVTRELLLKGGDGGAAVVPGKSGDGLFMSSIRHEDDDLKMPHKADKLPDAVIAKFAQWIDLGAPYARPLIEGAAARDKSKVSDADRRWWSFQPLATPQPPAVKDEAWCRTPIDRFILAKLEEKGIAPNPPADPRKLIRRAYFDLLGLPPSPEQVEAFVGASPEARNATLDALLASPHYGERWGRHWLDLARYAESHGYEQDYDRPNAYHYRDFVIRALNADQPYDEFVRWQIAGDELAPENPEAWKATGFLAAGTHATQITANQAEKERYDELDDKIGTIGTAMLGLTVACARCHDHKFDPIPTADYYRLISTFTTTVRSDHDIILNPAEYHPAKERWDREHAPLMAARASFEKEQLPVRFADWEQAGGTFVAPQVSGDTKDKKAAEEAKTLAEVERILTIAAPQRKPEETQKLLAWYRHQDADWQALDAAVAAHAKIEPLPEKITALVASEGLKAVRLHTQGPDFYEKTFFLKRGDVNQKQAEALQGFLQVVSRGEEQRWLVTPPAGARTPFRRAALANWMTDAETGAGHLLARVIVNRLWQHHFGRGLVATPSDFGVQGDKPTHPELLDWLAGELIRNSWRLKPVHRLIMSSTVYQQSTARDARQAVDPDNKLLWRRTPQRLEGEVIRDAILAATDTLDPTMFGPGSLKPEMKRRSIYFQIKRSALPPMLVTFDAPDTLQSMGQRSTTTVAPQALHLMNNATVRAAAKTWAKTLGALPPEAAVQRAYLTALGRTPEAGELADVTAFVATQTESYRAAGKADAAPLALADFCQSLLSTNEFVYVE